MGLFFLEVGVVRDGFRRRTCEQFCVAERFFFCFVCFVAHSATSARGRTKKSGAQARAMPPTPPLSQRPQSIPPARANPPTPRHSFKAASATSIISHDNFDDRGWGCGWRTVQTILSWLKPEDEAPSIAALQRLVGHDVGASSWIGVQECVEILDALHGAIVQIVPLRSGAELLNHLPRLLKHFADGGGPLMIGGGADVYSKTIIGARTGGPDGPSLLVLDPHYVGDAVHSGNAVALREGKWAAWRPIRSLMSATSFYNVALPRRGAAVGIKAPPTRRRVIRARHRRLGVADRGG